MSGELSMFMPQIRLARAEFCKTIAQLLPITVEQWIVGGDFNMIEGIEDWKGGLCSMISG